MSNTYKNIQILSWTDWGKGLIRSLISGGSGALAAGLGHIVADFFMPGEKRNFAHFILLCSCAFFVAGMIRLLEFLEKYPIPNDPFARIK